MHTDPYDDSQPTSAADEMLRRHGVDISNARIHTRKGVDYSEIDPEMLDEVRNQLIDDDLGDEQSTSVDIDDEPLF